MEKAKRAHKMRCKEIFVNKRIRQYIGLLVAIVSYYAIHEGAHLIYALITGVFKQINVMALGVQIDVFADKMTDIQMGMFCIIGSIATIISAYVLVVTSNKIVQVPSNVFKACAYYTTMAMLFLDPLYLSVICGFFGGGDMNGIALIMPEIVARMAYGVLFVINTVVFCKIVLPKYKFAFGNEP